MEICKKQNIWRPSWIYANETNVKLPCILFQTIPFVQKYVYNNLICNKISIESSYSQFSLSRSRRDCIKYIDIAELRHKHLAEFSLHKRTKN